MYSPTYTITHLILNYIVRIELAISYINNTPLPASHFSQIYEKLHAEDIDKFGELIGFPIGYSKALDAQRGKLMPSIKPKLRIFANYRSVHDFIDSYSPSNFIKPSFDLSMHLNKLVFKYIVDEWDISKLRGFSDKPNEIYDNWYKFRDFYPSLDPKKHFIDIFSWIEAPRYKINKLIQISCLLYEFIDKAPYASGNQITSILTTSVMLKAYGYNPKNIVPIAKTVYLISDDLISAYKISKNKRDITSFIEAFLYSLSITTTNVANSIKEIYETKSSKIGQMQEELNERQLKIIEYLEIEKKITRMQYTKMMGISFMTSFRDLQEMLEKGYIIQKGKGRATFYILPKKEQSNDDIQLSD